MPSKCYLVSSRGDNERKRGVISAGKELETIYPEKREQQKIEQIPAARSERENVNQ